MINSQRLEKILHNKEWLKAQSHLLQVYECLSKEQRSILKEMFNNNKKRK